MRTVMVNGQSGIIAATGSGPNAGKVFVLFDGDDVNEMSADWFAEGDVTTFAPGDTVTAYGSTGTVLDGSKMDREENVRVILVRDDMDMPGDATWVPVDRVSALAMVKLDRV